MNEKIVVEKNWYQKTEKEFSLMPFWFWNDELTKDELDRQMDAFKEKGIDGFVIHPRLGLPEDIPYLCERWFDFVTYAVEGACKRDMTVVLYDEAMYPSGSCHGAVVAQNPSYASQALAMRRKGDPILDGEKLIAQYTREGVDYRFVQTPSGGTIRGVHYGEDDGEERAPKSADLLNPAAVAAFISLTHEVYYAHLKPYFGSTIRAFFTDEPNILGRNARSGLLPWSDGIFEAFCKAGGAVSDLYVLFAQDNEMQKTLSVAEQKRLSYARALYKKVLYMRLSTAYYQQLSSWCASHAIALTGHPEKSTDIGYLQQFQIPCQDIVWRFVAPEDDKAIVGEHSTMAKCSADSARHRGKRRNGNECFGCCGKIDNPKKFTKNDFLWYVNWLFVRGVNLLYPHAFYYSVRDKRGDERPPEVGMHSEFWDEYRALSDYVKRMCALNTDAKNCAEVAVLCSFDELSWQIAKPLFIHQIEFNYLETELLPACTLKNNCCCIADYQYKVLVRDCYFDEATEKWLTEFEKKGGTVLFYGEENALLASLASKHVQPVLEVAENGLNVCNLRCASLEKMGSRYLLITNEGLTPIEADIVAPRVISAVYDALGNTEQVCQRRDYHLQLPPFCSRILLLEP